MKGLYFELMVGPVRRRVPMPVLLAILATSSGIALAATEDGPSLGDFPVLAQRNIFDSTRRPNRPPTRAEPERAPPPRRETVALTGSLVRPNKAYAFFSSPDPEFARIVSPEDRLGDFTVADITTTNVLLRIETSSWHLAVGEQLVREDDGPWEHGGGATPGPAPADPAAGSAGPTEAAADDGGTEGMSDVMRRLMERRQQELAQ